MSNAFFIAIASGAQTAAGGGPGPGGEAHAYWRIRYRFPDADNIQFAEILFLDSEGDDLCVGGTVIKSSQYDAGTPYYGAANAFDRNNTTGYAALGNANNWIGYHFASAVAVTTVGVVGSGSFPANNAKGMLVEFSDDGTTWTTYYTFVDPGGNLTAGTRRDFDIVPDNHDFDTDPHRYWRIRILALHNNATYQEIEEIQFQNAAGTDLTISGGTASASSTFSTYFPSFAFDNTTSFGWRAGSNVAEAWIKWDFGSGLEQAVEKLMLRAFTGAFMPAAFAVEYSDDDTTWFMRYIANAEAPWSNNETRTYTF